ncbi:NtaA/DmoA family FMN-dependent monooxygenase [Planosporangium flavigriseum]|uniref:Monooxygenase n=1 Tax=Planosporangium flavigriseum TaxID=373681 RepID=A0A8J3PPV3_9ACTN|nr:NtaA/DmoA family FMN-dependent monooxygenase [Planosporangium flavigriseum]NJC63145.1 NtaA/DmoA family FMN-dependent monooxygenase [Planosporangium flavigriseum]GIG76759.1 monooxygenase [Planosporangium flavigriseum]
MRNEKMILSAFLLPGGYDWRAWRLPGSRSEELGQFEIIAEIAQAYERAKLDSIFIADIISAAPLLEGDVKMGSPYEPVTALSALASVTSRIGLIGTVSTTFNHPFTVARQLGALDVLSGGRAGWNIVTSSRAEENYGIEMPAKEVRYRRALEFVDVVKQLWTSWSDKAVINDRENGRWVDPELIRLIDHEGEFFKVAGFINQRRSPQGHPVLVQAGQSSGGLNLGAEVAEAIYTAQPQREKAIEYYADYKANIQSKGRNPNHTKILPGLIPYVGMTEDEARDVQNSLARFVDFDALRADLATQYGLKLDDVDLDDRIPEERFEGKNDDNAGTRFMAYRHLAVEEKYTLREILINRSSVGGHLMLSGTPSKIADRMIDWFENRACDGFSLNAPAIPQSVTQICELLIPELQERGYFRTEYEGETLREHLGLPIPPAWDV